jgi:hypothetical protein
MNAYVLKRKGAGYDEYDEMVVMANDADEARRVAAEWIERKTDEDYADDYLKPSKSTVRLDKVTKPHVVQVNFWPG